MAPGNLTLKPSSSQRPSCVVPLGRRDQLGSGVLGRQRLPATALSGPCQGPWLPGRLQCRAPSFLLRTMRPRLVHIHLPTSALHQVPWRAGNEQHTLHDLLHQQRRHWHQRRSLVMVRMLRGETFDTPVTSASFTCDCVSDSDHQPPFPPTPSPPHSTAACPCSLRAKPTTRPPRAQLRAPALRVVSCMASPTTKLNGLSSSC